VFVKHFERDGRRLETRLLVVTPAGVYDVAYRWRPALSDDDLVRKGRTEGGWYVPGPDDCRKCHLPVTGGVTGVTPHQLNRDGPTGGNQPLAWDRLGLFDAPPGDPTALPRLPQFDDPHAGPADRARAYLDANRGYCRRPGGAAADFDARYETPLDRQALVDAPARINLGLDHARQIAPNDPRRSMVLVRLTTLEQTKLPPWLTRRSTPAGPQYRAS
jgi:hypothetical protein